MVECAQIPTTWCVPGGIALIVALVAAASPIARADGDGARDAAVSLDAERAPDPDLSFDFGGFEEWVTAARHGLRIDERVTLPSLWIAGVGVTSARLEKLNLGTSDVQHGLVEAAAGDDYVWQAGTVRFDLGHRPLVATIAVDSVNRWGAGHRLGTPRFGVRLGDPATVALTAELALPAAFLVATDATPRSLRRDYDLETRASLALSASVRLEARGRARRFTTDELHQADVLVAIGLAAAVRDGGFRCAPAYLGLGLRWVREHRERRYQPVREAEELLPVEPDGASAMLVADWQLSIADSPHVD